MALQTQISYIGETREALNRVAGTRFRRFWSFHESFLRGYFDLGKRIRYRAFLWRFCEFSLRLTWPRRFENFQNFSSVDGGRNEIVGSKNTVIDKPRAHRVCGAQFRRRMAVARVRLKAKNSDENSKNVATLRVAFLVFWHCNFLGNGRRRPGKNYVRNALAVLEIFFFQLIATQILP